MAVAYQNRVSIGFIDHSGEKSTTKFYIEPFANTAAADLGTDLVDKHDAVKAAIAAVTLCNFTTSHMSVAYDVDSAVVPTDAFAQRETALWIQWQDSVNGKYGSMSIPGPDLDLLAQAGTDEVDLASNVAAIALTGVLELNLVSEFGNAINITRMRIVGRSN